MATTVEEMNKIRGIDKDKLVQIAIYSGHEQANQELLSISTIAELLMSAETGSLSNGKSNDSGEQMVYIWTHRLYVNLNISFPLDIDNIEKWIPVPCNSMNFPLY